MPDQSSAATEHAILQEITAPLATLPDDPVSIVQADFPAALRGYDRMAVDAYVKQIGQLVAELQATRSPEAAVRRALERVGEQISGILQRAHETAEQITSQSRAEAEDRLEQARGEAAQMTADAEQRVKDLDADTDRIWAERHRIVSDTRELAGQLVGLADTAAERFPPAEEAEGPSVLYDDQAPEDGRGEATVAFPAIDSGSEDEAAAELAYEDAAAEPDYGDAAAQPADKDAAGELAYEDAAADPDCEPAPATPPPVAADDRPAEERPGEHDSTAVIPPASQAAHRRAGS